MQERKDKWCVGEWMTQNPFTIFPETSVRVAFFKMRFEGVRHLPVIGDDDTLIGIVSDRDLRRPDVTDEPDGWDDFYKLDGDYEVRDIMTTDVKTVGSKESLKKALGLMLEHRFSALPVLDKKGGLLGILSSHDLIRAFSEYMKATEES